MTSSRELQQRQALYASLHQILSALKAMAYVEVHKLQSVMACQQAISARMQARCFQLQRQCGFPYRQDLPPLQILIGTERGFCGDINLRVRRAVRDTSSMSAPDLILVGARLTQQFENQGEGDDTTASANIIAGLSGASIMDDVEEVAEALLARLLEERPVTSEGVPCVDVVYLSSTDDRINRFRLLGPVMDQDQLEAPLSYLSAPDGWRSLWPLYSQCALQACLSESLLSENRKRLLHLDKAVRHLNEKSEALHNSANRLRQEQIIEDIEVLLG